MKLTSFKVQDAVAFKQSMKESILSGQTNPLEFYATAKLLTDAIDEVKKDNEVMDCAFDEVAKYGKEKAVINGSVIAQGSRTIFDYTSCGDSVYNELKEKLKAREMFLKGLPPEGAVNPDTGEFIKAPKTSTSNFITVKI